MKTSELTNEQKAKLRKVKTVSGEVKVAMYKGNHPPVCMQFNSDVRLYNLYEAILYLENYESEGQCAKGTASRVLEASGIADMVLSDKQKLYRAGLYKFNPPPACHASWTEDDWIRYIDGGGGAWIEKRFSVVEYASHYSVRDNLSGKEAVMGDGVDTVFRKDDSPVLPGTPEFIPAWEELLNADTQETEDAYF